MTKINKLIMHGFKSFARRTELLFNDDFNCVVGPNGAGKCVDYDTLVQLADGRRIKIGDLVEEKLKINDYYEIDDGYVIDGDDTEILSLDVNNLKISKRKISRFIKRTSPETLLRIKTRSGREIMATEYHPLFVLENNKIKSLKAEELKEGIKVAVPRLLDINPDSKTFVEFLDAISPKDSVYVPYNEAFKEAILSCKKRHTFKELAKKIGIPSNAIKGLLDKQAINFVYLVKILRYVGLDDNEIIKIIPKLKAKTSGISYKIPWNNSPELARFFGYLMAEGRLPPNSDQIWFVNGTEEIAGDYVNLIKKLFGIEPLIRGYKENAYDIIFYSAPIRIFLSKLGMGIDGTVNKKITNLFLSHSSNEELGEFLNGLYSGDGYVSDSSIEITTKSFNLANGIETILTRLGILFNSSIKIKVAANSGFSGVYKQVNITGQDNMQIFLSHVRFVHPEKRKKLESITNKKINPNLDLIDANFLIKQVAKDLKLNIKKLKKDFPRLDAYSYNQCTPSRYGVQHLIDRLFDKSSLAGGSQNLVVLKLLAYSDIYWDEVIEIEKVKAVHDYVYDLTIEQNHNFVANNFIVHNSNILDALCFVLGKSSAKAMRSERSSHLIYNGGKSKKPAEKAEVSIFFENGKRDFPYEVDEIKVSRFVNQKGNSAYKINDKTVTRQQVVELLSLAKIDVDGHNIVLQGDIAKFCEMGGEERRLLIEEIAGISVYEDKKNKALSEMQRVEEKLKEAEIILKERGDYLKELKNERDEAMKYSNLNSKLKTNRASYLYRQIDRKSRDFSRYDEELKKQNEAIQKQQNIVNELKEQISQKKAQIDEMNSEIETKGEQEQVNLHKEVEELRVHIGTSRNKIESLKNEITKAKQRKEQLHESIKEVREKIKAIEDEQKAAEKETASKNKELELITKRIEDFRKKNKLDDASEIEKQMDELDRNAEESQKQAQDLRQRQQDLLREKDKTEFQLKVLDEKMEKVLELEKENKAQLDELKNKKEEFKKAASELSQEISRNSNISAQLATARAKLNTSDEELSKIKSRLAALRETDGAISEVLSQKGKIKGIFGTISELGKVSSKYALALEVAAAQRIKSVVVDSDATAHRCIEFLKSGKIGIANFIPLNKIKAAAITESMKNYAKQDGAIGFAVDLISFDKKYEAAFNYVFGSTLIVENLDIARKIGIGSIKMVALDGDVAEASGLMQGGFRIKKASGFSQIELDEELKKYESAVNDSKSLITRLEKEREQTENYIAKLRQQKANLEADIIKLEKTLHLEADDTDASRKVKKEQEALLIKLDREIEKISQDISDINAEITEAKTKKQELRDKISQLRNPVLLAELNTFEERKSQLKEEIIKLEGISNNLGLQIRTILSPEAEKTFSIIKQHDKEEEEFNNEITRLKEEISSGSKSLKEKEELEEKFMKQFKGLFVKRQKLDGEIGNLTDKIENANEKTRKEELELNTNKIESVRISTELEALKKEYEQYEGVELDMNASESELKSQISKYESMLAKMDSVNMKSLEMYDTAEVEYGKLTEKKSQLDSERQDVLALINEIDTKKIELFTTSFEAVNEHFKATFSQLLTKGSEAFLKLENPQDPFSAGVDIRVKLSGTKFLDIRSLSGGEKTMTALAFIFSIQDFEPASFYILDEVDASLDKTNTERLASLVRKYSEKAQYIMISHNDGVVSSANTLYGISMDKEGVSNVVSLKL